MSEEEKIALGAAEVFTLCPIVVLAGCFTDGIALKIMLCLVLFVAMAEIIVTRIDRGIDSTVAYSSYLFELTMLILAFVIVVENVVSAKALILIILSITAADVGAYLFEGMGEERYFWRVYKYFGIKRTRFRYLGAALLFLCVACIVGISFEFKINFVIIAYFAAGWVIASLGEIASAVYLKSFCIKTSNETLIQIPVVGWIEAVFRPSGGYLGVADSIAPAIIFYAILQQISTS
jgi:hypothetical protein